MQAALQFAGLAIAILGSIAFAIFLEWLSLLGLMKLMPAKRPVPVPVRVVPFHARRLRLGATAR